MNWVKVLYPVQRSVYIGKKRSKKKLGNTNTLQFLGEDATHTFSLGDPLDYKPKSMRRRVAGSSRWAPLILKFKRR